jgi:hypothetical protein
MQRRWAVIWLAALAAAVAPAAAAATPPAVQSSALGGGGFQNVIAIDPAGSAASAPTSTRQAPA